MTTQRVIDSDTHVDETNATWEYMTVEEEAYKPTIRFDPSPDPGSPGRPYWLVDGQRQRRPDRNDSTSRTTAETRELIDVEARLRHMDELGTDVQVIYPTLFITDPAPRPEVELSLTRSYNRWLADRCAVAKGRLRWICVPPLKNMEAALEELRFAKDHGACGVLKKGDEEAGHWPSDPYFFPLYEEAERLDMPICFHTGTGAAESIGDTSFFNRKAPVINGVWSLLVHSVPSRFPKLRLGCIEAGAAWVPMMVHALRRDAQRFDQASNDVQRSRYEVADNLFKANNIYVACLMDDNLPMVLQYVGADNLLAGSDYSHNDSSQEHKFLRILEERASQGEIPQDAVRKIVYDNPKSFYAL